MVGQNNGSPERRNSNLSSDMGDFVQDLISLTELQAQLFVADVKECTQHGFAPALFLLCGTAIGLACFPIALIAMAFLLVQIFEISYAGGFLIAFLVGTMVSVLLTIVGWVQVCKQLHVLRRSQHELVRNLNWVKKVLERKRVTRRLNSSENSWRTKP